MEQRNLIDGTHRDAPRVPPEGRSPVRLRLSLPARTRSSKATCRSCGRVAERWRIIGRYSYSFLDKERLEDFLGWEYEACCWRLRMVNRNYVSRRTGETDSSISMQLELKGLSQRVTAPDDLLDRGILGYRNIARAY